MRGIHVGLTGLSTIVFSLRIVSGIIINQSVFVVFRWVLAIFGLRLLFYFEIARLVKFIELHLILNLLLIQNVNLVWAFVSLIKLVVVLGALDRVVLIKRMRLLVFYLLVRIAQ